MQFELSETQRMVQGTARDFATRVVASTGADLGACVVAGFGALSGPRHGAAVELILDMLDAIGEPDAAVEWMRAEIADGRRIMGFGHSVYRAAAGGSPSMLPKLPCPSINGARREKSWAMRTSVS